jgi:hypothetical protein
MFQVLLDQTAGSPTLTVRLTSLWGTAVYEGSPCGDMNDKITFFERPCRGWFREESSGRVSDGRFCPSDSPFSPVKSETGASQ